MYATKDRKMNDDGKPDIEQLRKENLVLRGQNAILIKMTTDAIEECRYWHERCQRLQQRGARVDGNGK